jgi:hypothetical protein
LSPDGGETELRTQLSWLAIAGALSFVVTSCTGSPQSPISPSAAAGGTTFARSDPATLKIDAPKVVTPTDDEVIDTRRPNLIWVNPTGKFAAMGLAYEIELRDAADAVVYSIIVGETAEIGSHIVPFDLDVDKAYYWQVRGVANTAAGLSTGPWSITGGFRTPKPTAQNAPAPGAGQGPSDGTVGPPRKIDFNEAWTIITTIHNVGGFDLGSRSTRDYRINFLFGAVAAIHYGHPRWNPAGPDSDWCVKDAGGGRPPSDDVLVRCGSREAWDLVAGAGANGYSFHRDFLGVLPSIQNVYPPPASARNFLPQ